MPGVVDPEGAHVAALQRLADFAGARVFEVGCGDGRLTLPIAEHASNVLAFDPDEGAVERARDTLPAELEQRVTYRVASAKAIEIPPSQFDIVLFSWSLWPAGRTSLPRARTRASAQPAPSPVGE
jgi:ubiquinone/menaquinone biosynthesis C-methylase UbiE